MNDSLDLNIVSCFEKKCGRGLHLIQMHHSQTCLGGHHACASVNVIQIVAVFPTLILNDPNAPQLNSCKSKCHRDKQKRKKGFHLQN